MDLLKNYRLIPLEETEESIKLMVPKNADPFILEEIRFLTKKRVETVFVQQEEFTQELQKRLAEEEVIIDSSGGDVERKKDILLEEGEGPTVSFVNSSLIKATALSASDIHIEPYEDVSSVRFRLDGILHDYMSIPISLHESVVSRIKVLANLNVAEKRVPQDGKIRVRIGGRDLDIRVSVVPTTFGERVVLRLLDRSGSILKLEELGLSGKDLDALQELAKKPYGIVLATGPTGAGKSTTLYAILLHIKSPEKNIITIEDPPEYQVKGVSQIQVNPKVGLTFANGLRAILRQDPDIIMVGEIRDSETAEIAVHAALTGHLVLSTLHTNDAPSAITRLSDLGIEPFLIASSLEGVIAQRLVRKICPYCKESYKPTKEELRELGLEGEHILYKGSGCDMCMGTGYRGRTGIYEVLKMDDELKSLITKVQDANLIRKKAKERGFRTMQEDGIEKVLKGITTTQELLRAVRMEG